MTARSRSERRRQGLGREGGEEQRDLERLGQQGADPEILCAPGHLGGTEGRHHHRDGSRLGGSCFRPGAETVSVRKREIEEEGIETLPAGGNEKRPDRPGNLYLVATSGQEASEVLGEERFVLEYEDAAAHDEER